MTKILNMKKVLMPIMAAAFIFFSCGDAESTEGENKENTENKQEETTDSTEVTAEEEEMTINFDEVVQANKDYRTEVEGILESLEKKEMTTDEMRAQIKQKWATIHFYSKDGQLVRIKTYPHEANSKRTEEFYLKDGQLLVAVIEDNGLNSKGASDETADKVYYFKDGMKVSEEYNTEETEYAIKDSDAERLMQEVKEYMEYFNK